MSKAPLATAAYDGKLADVRELLQQKADVNGSDGELSGEESEGCRKGAPYYTPLGEAARAGHPEIVRLLLGAGAAVDGRNYRNETPFVLAAQRGQLEAMRVLIDAGADIHVICCMGNALSYVVTSSNANTEVIALLVRAGVKADVKDAFSRTAIQHIADALPKRGKLEGWHKKMLEFLPMLEPVFGNEAALAKATQERFGKKSASQDKKSAKTEDTFANLGSKAATKDKGWPKTIRALIGPVDKHGADLERLCRLTLSTPDAIAHPKWPEIVRAVLDQSLSYADVTARTYGERLSLEQRDDDEGSALDFYADEHLYTFDWVLRLLAIPEAIAHDDWASLVTLVCTTKAKAIGAMSFGDEEIAALLAMPRAKKHPKRASLASAAKKAFPYAKI